MTFLITKIAVLWRSVGGLHSEVVGVGSMCEAKAQSISYCIQLLV